jgi:hypothetical protein
MQQKTITVVIAQNGDSSVDLEGFAGQGCDKGPEGLPGRRSRESTAKESRVLWHGRRLAQPTS